MLKYFTKSELPIDPETLHSSVQKRLKRVMDRANNQNPSLAFNYFWFSLKKKHKKAHPSKSNYVTWRGYDDADLFLVWYGKANRNKIIGDPCGKYRELWDSREPWDLSGVPIKPDGLIDTYILDILRFYRKSKGVRVRYKPPLFPVLSPVILKYLKITNPTGLNTEVDYKSLDTDIIYNPSYYICRTLIGEYLRIYAVTINPKLLQWLKLEFSIWQI